MSGSDGCGALQRLSLLLCALTAACLARSSVSLRSALARSSLGIALLASPPLLQPSTAAEAPSTNYILTKEYLAEGADLRREAGAADSTKMSARSLLIRASEKVLTTKVLENFRKADQLEKDEVLQLDADNKVQQMSKVLLLYPIVEIQEDLRAIRANLIAIRDDSTGDSAGNGERVKALVEKSLALIQQDKYDIKSFKKIFNRYSDNIMYTNVAEANIYLAGGTTPNSLQTEQYLYRNAALTSVNFIKEDLLALKTQLRAAADLQQSQEVQDSIEDCDDSLSALDSYFERADPQDLKMAKEIFAKKE